VLPVDDEMDATVEPAELAESAEVAEPAEATEATEADVVAVAPPAAPKPKAITWETDRNAALAALLRAGASEREARVLASLAANAGTALRNEARQGRGDVTTANDRAAATVLAAHRAGGPPPE